MKTAAPHPPTIRFCLALLFSCLITHFAIGQAPASGVIEGRVFDAAGNALRNARVSVEGSRTEVLTNEAGEYRLSNVPTGQATVKATFGLVGTQAARLAVAAGQTQRHDFTLSSEIAPAEGAPIKMAEFTVEGRELSAQAAAIEEQRNAANIKNVVSFQEFADLGEGNPGEFLKYIPGVQIEQSPATPSVATLRGMPANGTLVTVDGVQIAGILAANRDFAFSGSDVASIDRVEVTKVPTPDMPANAVGGGINMISRSGFNYKAPVFNYRIYGTLSSLEPRKFFSQLGKKQGSDSKTDVLATQPGIDLSYAGPLGKSVAFSATYTYNDRFEDMDYITQTWDRVRGIQTAGGMQGSVRIRPRTILSGKIDWKPAENHLVSFSVQNLKEDFINRGFALTATYGAGAVGDAYFTQGASTGVGSMAQALTYRAQHRFSNYGILKYRFDNKRWLVDTYVQRSGGGENSKNIEDGNFQNASVTLANLTLRGEGFDRIGDRRAPRITASRAGQAVDVHNGNLYTLATTASFIQPNRQDAETAALNVSRIFDTRNPLTLKAGASIDKVDRRVRSQTLSYAFNPPASVGRTVADLGVINSEYSGDGPHFQDNVTVQWVDMHKVTQLYKDHPDWFTLNEASAHTSRVQGSKDLMETITAGYVRSDLRLLQNKLWVVAGVRFERTEDEGRGPLNDPAAIYRRDSAGRFLRGPNNELLPITTDPLERTKLQNKELASYKKASYQDYYPSINTSYSLTDDFVFRAAFARTIGRPNLSFILPGVTITDINANTLDRRITVINSALDPWEANNYDLSFEAYNIKGGTASVSVFRKEIKGFFTTVRTPVTPADLAEFGLSSDYNDYDIVTSENSNDDITVDGLEFSWRQSLKPLAGVPHWAHPIQVFFNTSFKRLSGPGRDNFTDFTPKLVSWGVTYASKRVLAKVNVNQTAPLRNGVLATNATTPAGSYNSQAYRCLIDTSFEYMFSKRFSIYGSARNVGQFARRVLVVSPNAPDYTRPTQYNYYGVYFTFGVKGTF